MPGARSRVTGWDSGEPGWEQKPQQWLRRAGTASGQGGQRWGGRLLQVSGSHSRLEEKRKLHTYMASEIVAPTLSLYEPVDKLAL